MAKRVLEFVCVEEPVRVTRGWREALRLMPKKISRKQFHDQLDTILNDLVAALPILETKRPKYEIDTLEFSVVIDTEGSLRIFGSGIKGGVAGGIKVTLKRAYRQT